MNYDNISKFHLEESNFSNLISHLLLNPNSPEFQQAYSIISQIQATKPNEILFFSNQLIINSDIPINIRIMSTILSIQIFRNVTSLKGIKEETKLDSSLIEQMFKNCFLILIKIPEATLLSNIIELLSRIILYDFSNGNSFDFVPKVLQQFATTSSSDIVVSISKIILNLIHYSIINFDSFAFLLSTLFGILSNSNVSESLIISCLSLLCSTIKTKHFSDLISNSNFQNLFFSVLINYTINQFSDIIISSVFHLWKVTFRYFMPLCSSFFSELISSSISIISKISISSPALQSISKFFITVSTSLLNVNNINNKDNNVSQEITTFSAFIPILITLFSNICSSSPIDTVSDSCEDDPIAYPNFALSEIASFDPEHSCPILFDIGMNNITKENFGLREGALICFYIFLENANPTLEQLQILYQVIDISLSDPCQRIRNNAIYVLQLIFVFFNDCDEDEDIQSCFEYFLGFHIRICELLEDPTSRKDATSILGYFYMVPGIIEKITDLFCTQELELSNAAHKSLHYISMNCLDNFKELYLCSLIQTASLNLPDILVENIWIDIGDLLVRMEGMVIDTTRIWNTIQHTLQRDPGFLSSLLSPMGVLGIISAPYFPFYAESIRLFMIPFTDPNFYIFIYSASFAINLFATKYDISPIINPVFQALINVEVKFEPSLGYVFKMVENMMKKFNGFSSPYCPTLIDKFLDMKMDFSLFFKNKDYTEEEVETLFCNLINFLLTSITLFHEMHFKLAEKAELKIVSFLMTLSKNNHPSENELIISVEALHIFISIFPEQIKNLWTVEQSNTQNWIIVLLREAMEDNIRMHEIDEIIDFFQKS